MPIPKKQKPPQPASLRLLDGWRVHTGCLVGLAQLPVRIDVLLMLGVAVGEDVTALAIGDEVERFSIWLVSAPHELRLRRDCR